MPAFDPTRPECATPVRAEWYLDETKLTELARAFFANACGLLSDAEVMLRAERWSRSHFLAAVALEELARTQILLLFQPDVHGHDQDDAEPGPDHGPDHGDGGPEPESGHVQPFLAVLLACLAPGGPRDQIKALSDLVERSEGFLFSGLAVEQTQGTPVAPSLIDREQAGRMLQLVNAAFDVVAGLWRSDDELWTRMYGSIPVS